MMILNLTPKPKQYSTKTFLEWVNPLRLVERLIIPGIVTPKKIGRRQGQNITRSVYSVERVNPDFSQTSAIAYEATNNHSVRPVK
jgi:hypothetical protein